MASNDDWVEMPLAKAAGDDWEEVPPGPPLPAGDKTNAGEALLRSAAQGASLGFADEATAGVAAARDYLAAKMGLRGDIGLGDAYETNRNAFRARDATAKDEHPYASVAGGVLGGLGTAFVPGLGALNAAAKTGMAARVGTAAGAGALMGAGDSTSNPFESYDDLKGFAGDVATGGAIGGATQGVLDKAVPFVAQKAKVAAKWGGKKAASLLGGVSEENVSKYLANPEAVNKAKTLDEIRHSVENEVGKLQYDVGEKQGLVRAAETKLNSLGTELSDAFKNTREKIMLAADERRLALSEAGRDSKDALSANLNDAKEKLWRAYETEIEKLRGVKPPEELRQVILGDIKDLARSASQGSSAAYEVLEGADIAVPVKRLKGYLTSKMNDLKIGEAIPEGEWGQQHGRLGSYRAFLDQIGQKDLDGPTAKKLIQMIDADTEGLYTQAAGRYTPPGARSLKDFRGTVDEYLKDHAPYAEAMAPVRDKTRLLEKLREQGLTDEESLAGKLASIHTDKSEFSRKALEDLEQATGKSYMPQIQEYLGAKRVLGSNLEKDALERSLPEYQALQNAKNSISSFDPQALPESRQYQRALDAIDQFSPAKTTKAQQLMLESSPATAELRGAQDGLADSQQMAKQFSGWSPGSIESRLKSVMSGRSGFNKEQLEALSSQSGQNFSEMLDNRKVSDSFEKGFTHGSRNVNLWSILGGVVGGKAITGGDAPILQAFGAGFGGTVDQFGPRMTKMGLDGYMALSGGYGADKLPDILRKTPQLFGKFAGPLMEAAKRGNQSLAATNFVLSQTDEEYRQKHKEIFGSGDARP